MRKRFPFNAEKAKKGVLTHASTLCEATLVTFQPH